VERYTLLRHIASGGMGEVYEALDQKLDRRVALKKIRRDVFPSPEVAERFRREARAAARLDHPNIVPVYDSGESAGQQFFTMALVEGDSLTIRVAGGGPMSPADAVRLMIPIVEAIGHAHERNLVHRDLKPDNVLIDKEGRPRITDFGLARHLIDPVTLTGPAQMLGTPRYMAPEQVRPAMGAIGPRTDLYALGGLLVYMLTGRPPVPGDSLPEILMNVLDRPSLLPRDQRPDVPDALNDICRKCLQKNPKDRFATAGELRDALANALQPVSRPIPPRPAAKRRKLVALLAAVGLGVLLAIVAMKAWRGNHHADKLAKKADESPTQPRPGGTDDPPLKKQPPPGRTEPLVHSLEGHKGRVWTAFGPDSRSLVSSGDDMTVRAWDVTTGKPLEPLLNPMKEKAWAMSLRVSPDQKAVAAALSAGSARVWTLPDWEERVVYVDDASGVTAVAFSPDGTKLAVGVDSGVLKIFDWKAGKELANCDGHKDRILDRGLFFSADGKQLVSASRDDSVRVWDVATGKKITAIPNLTSIWAVVPTPDPNRAVVIQGDYVKDVRVFDLKKGLMEKNLLKGSVDDYALSSNAKTLWVVGEGDYGLMAWDLVGMKKSFADRNVQGRQIAVVPATNCLLVGGSSDPARRTRLDVFRVTESAAEHVRIVQEHRWPIVSLNVSPDGKRVATTDENGVIKVWDAAALTRPK
jgi:eukaryotic-like serine/threonine-protein kinase